MAYLEAGWRAGLVGKQMVALAGNTDLCMRFISSWIRRHGSVLRVWLLFVGCLMQNSGRSPCEKVWITGKLFFFLSYLANVGFPSV